MDFLNVKNRLFNTYRKRLGIPFLKDSELKKIDYDFIKYIMPAGGINFKDDSKIIKTGSGYEACIYVHEYPTEVFDYWLTDFTSVDNAIVVFDIATISDHIVKLNLKKSLKEQRLRQNTAKTDAEYIDAVNEFNDQKDLYIVVQRYGKIMKSLNVRMYLPDKTRQGVDKKIENTIIHLDSKNYKGSVCVDETKSDYVNMFTSYSKQQENIYGRKGKSILAETLAYGIPFHFDCLQDPYGYYLGQTSTNGTVFFDLYHTDATRNSYNFLTLGKMGSGKSTLLKKILKDRAMRGDNIRVFDIEGEFIKLAQQLGGEIISLDGGSSNKVNMFQIMPTSDNIQNSYQEHISKIQTIYKYLNHDANENEVNQLSILLNRLYRKYNIVNDEGDVIVDFTKIKAEEFPKLKDFNDLISELITNKEQFIKEGVIRQENMPYITSIENTFQSLFTGYKNIFDCYTKTQDIAGEQIVVFDMSKLKSLKEEIFDAQFFQVFSMCWSDAVEKGKKEKEDMYAGLKEKEDINHTVIIIDEAHHFVNARKTAGVGIFSQLSRQARKYFISLGLSTQRVSDFIPDNVSQQNYDDLKTLFALTTYRFIFKQDVADMDKFSSVFQNAITEIEKQSIPTFEQGRCILSIAGFKNVEINKIHLTDEESVIFDGGV